jgi:SAM-dependent methyltransferase
MSRHPRATALLLNPDAHDLAATQLLARELGLDGRCRFERSTVAEAPLGAEAFDLVTSLSVVEHIPAPGDSEAVSRMWRAVRPGGRLVLTVPCSREAYEEYVDLDEYGLQPADASGLHFGQTFYDEALLAQRIYSMCGTPSRVAVFGEREPGTFAEDRARKVRGAWRPEREPWMMATAYRRYGAVRELPGAGVVGLEFRKPTSASRGT